MSDFMSHFHLFYSGVELVKAIFRVNVHSHMKMISQIDVFFLVVRVK